MDKVKMEITIDPSDQRQVDALYRFMQSVGGHATVVSETEKPKAEKPKAEKPKAEKPKAEEPAEESKDDSIKIADVRALLAKKVADNREQIKETLETKFEAPNVTKLDKKHYVAFMEFLNSLK